jgi:putative FmdB family regulatory protein
MPIYEYDCPACHNRFEKLMPFSRSEEDAECPKCKKPAKRALSKFVSRIKDDLSYLSHMSNSTSSSGGGSSCGGCSSTNCSTCGH